MKLYVAIETATHMACGFSEEKKITLKFIERKNALTNDTYMVKYKGSDAEDLFNASDELELDDESKFGLVLTKLELSILDRIMDEERHRLRTIDKDLSHVTSAYFLTKEQRNVLEEATSIISSLNKFKRLKVVLDIKSTLVHLTKTTNVHSREQEYTDSILNKIR